MDAFDLDLALNMEYTLSCTIVEFPEPLPPPRSDGDDHHHHLMIKINCMPTVSAVGVCTVCMGDFQSSTGSGVCKQVPCGHVYHANCITQWLSHHNSCPLCRQQVPLPHHTHVDEKELTNLDHELTKWER